MSGVAHPWGQVALPKKGWSPPKEYTHDQQWVVTNFEYLDENVKSFFYSTSLFLAMNVMVMKGKVYIFSSWFDLHTQIFRGACLSRSGPVSHSV